MDEVGFEPTSYNSQDLASLHNNHSVTRLFFIITARRIWTHIFSFEDQCSTFKLELKFLILLIGIEPISSHSQYDILTLLNYKRFLSKVVGIEPTILILETSVLPFKLYPSLVWESNPRQRIKSPPHCHYANQGLLINLFF